MAPQYVVKPWGKLGVSGPAKSMKMTAPGGGGVRSAGGLLKKGRALARPRITASRTGSVPFMTTPGGRWCPRVAAPT